MIRTSACFCISFAWVQNELNYFCLAEQDQNQSSETLYGSSYVSGWFLVNKINKCYGISTKSLTKICSSPQSFNSRVPFLVRTILPLLIENRNSWLSGIFLKSFGLNLYSPSSFNSIVFWPYLFELCISLLPRSSILYVFSTVKITPCVFASSASHFKVKLDFLFIACYGRLRNRQHGW